jgi:hypothetical protein
MSADDDRSAISREVLVRTRETITSSTANLVVFGRDRSVSRARARRRGPTRVRSRRCRRRRRSSAKTRVDVHFGALEALPHPNGVSHVRMTGPTVNMTLGADGLSRSDVTMTPAGGAPAQLGVALPLTEGARAASVDILFRVGEERAPS